MPTWYRPVCVGVNTKQQVTRARRDGFAQEGSHGKRYFVCLGWFLPE
jgi:hypothetical protein